MSRSNIQQVVRCANDRADVPESFAKPLDTPDDADVMDMPAIPSEQVIEAMHSGNGNMRGIQGGVGGYQS